MILLVVGAGAFFGAVLQATGVGKALADSMAAIGPAGDRARRT